MRALLACAALILSTIIAGSAHASVGFSCGAKDSNVRLAIEAAYGTSLGGGAANFGGDIEIVAKDVPERLRRISLDLDHLGQNWFRGRDIKLVARWQSAEEEPYMEVTLVVETRRGEAEESPYVGTYELWVDAAPSEDRAEWLRFEASGEAACTVG
ncbi:MAG TPA: hypothetical protein VK148_30795 [Xanthobacteraceae bacterium]|jgi:hypothetical protein|nr:hypothetical protein [Xanthobacteraceae bacterium]